MPDQTSFMALPVHGAPSALKIRGRKQGVLEYLARFDRALRKPPLIGARQRVNGIVHVLR
jgi:hypothetical protein